MRFFASINTASISLTSISKILLPTIAAVLITGCSSAPTHVILSPQIIQTPNNTYLNTQASLSVVDMRTSNHIVQISEEGEAATILSSQQRLEDLISNTLTDTWKKQGIQFSDISSTKINITVDKAITSVTQKTMSYSAQSELIITVKIENAQQTLTNTFKSRGNSEGALKADIAVLERDFNSSLNTLLTQVVNSKDVSDFLTH